MRAASAMRARLAARELGFRHVGTLAKPADALALEERWDTWSCGSIMDAAERS